MIRKFAQIALIGAAILFPVSLSFAADSKAAATEDEDVPPARAKARAKQLEERHARAQAKAKLTEKEKAAKLKDDAAAKAKRIDINSASKEKLKTLPGIGDAEADKIIAGRPYLSKAQLLTHNVLPENNYEPIKRLIVAKQKDAAKGKKAK